MKEVAKKVEPTVDALEEKVEAMVAALQQVTCESAARRRVLCTPQLLAMLCHMLILPRLAVAQANAAASLVNLSIEPANKVPMVRAGAVMPLVELLRSDTSAPKTREHAAGALFGLALKEGNRVAVGVLGAVPPLLNLLTSPAHTPRACWDAEMALYHLSLAAMNQSKLSCAVGAAKALLSVASNIEEATPICRLVLMVICNLGACTEGQAALMDVGVVGMVAPMLSNSAGASDAELEEWCVTAMYAMSCGSLRFRGLARAAAMDRALRCVAEEGCNTAGARVHPQATTSIKSTL